jgi:NTE family protein
VADGEQPGVRREPEDAAPALEPQPGTRRCDLVLGGGGVRGVAHIGALTALEEADYQVVRAAGASAGAIAGAFAVAGVPAASLRELFEELDLASFVFSDVLDRWSGKRGVGRLVDRFSTDRTEPIQWLREVLADRGIRTFGDLAVDDPDPADPPERHYRLVVRCLDIVQRRVVRLPWDYARYGLDPDAQPVADAVRASMSVPMVYDPVLIGHDDASTGLLIDGGLTSGFPVTVLDRQDGAPPRWPTFGVRLLPRPRTQQTLPEGTFAMARMVIEALLDASDLLEPLTSADDLRTVRVDVSDVRPLNLDATDDHDLFREGHDAMAAFLGGWDFDRYLDRSGRSRDRSGAGS